MPTISRSEQTTDRIFRNYQKYIVEHEDMFGTTSGAMDVLNSEGLFNSYIKALTEGFDEHTVDVLTKVCKRERTVLLEESLQTGPSASVIGFAVTYFPILVDIYSDPVISQVATVFTTNKSILSIPKVQVKAEVQKPDGTSETYLIPRTQYLVRGLSETFTLAPSTNIDLFTQSNGGGGASLVNAKTARINKRYVTLKSIVIADTDAANAGASAGQITVALTSRPDARGNFNTEFNFNDVAGNKVVGKLIGTINWDNGSFHYNVSYTGAGGVYSTVSSDLELMFSPKTGDIGRVKVALQMEARDVNVDNREDFEIQLDTETIQDYRDIYNIDLVRYMSMAIKQQMLLNKDYDLAHFFNIYEPEMKSLGSFSSVDLNKFLTSGDFRPANSMDVFKGVIPAISYVTRRIRRNFRADPQYLIAGIKTATLLESLQEYVVTMPSTYFGEAGFSQNNAGASFKKLTVLPCDPIPDNRIYLVYRAPSDDLSRTAIADIIYKPLYIVEEIDNSTRRTFVKSRTTLEFTNIDAMGYIEVLNIDGLI